MSLPDVVVLGAGPAGLSLAAALAARGLQVRVISPSPPQPFVPTYGVWQDEWPTALQHVLRQSWADVRVYTQPEPTRLGRTYALLDNAALLAAFFPASGVEHCTDTITQTRYEGGQKLWQLRGAAGTLHQAPLLIDARGHAHSLGFDGGKAWQTAYGIVAHFERPPIAPHSAVWMDYSRHQDTFLYAMHLRDDIYFVEETSLIARPAPTKGALEARLWQRLRYKKSLPWRVLEEEWVAFPMNANLPARPQQPCLPYGAAGGMVHPISGFQVTAAVSKAPAVAEIVARHFGRSEQGQGDQQQALLACQAAWDWLWPPEYRLARELHLLGAQSLLGLAPHQHSRFFDAFFAQPSEDWRAFLRGDTPASQLAPLMWQVFMRLPMPLRQVLLGATGKRLASLLTSLAPIRLSQQ